MKIKFLIFCLVCFNLSYAGTPAIGDTSMIYLIALLLLAGFIGTPYLVRFIKKKIEESKKKDGENDLNDPHAPVHLGDH